MPHTSHAPDRLLELPPPNPLPWSCSLFGMAVFQAFTTAALHCFKGSTPMATPLLQLVGLRLPVGLVFVLVGVGCCCNGRPSLPARAKAFLLQFVRHGCPTAAIRRLPAARGSGRCYFCRPTLLPGASSVAATGGRRYFHGKMCCCYKSLAMAAPLLQFVSHLMSMFQALLSWASDVAATAGWSCFHERRRWCHPANRRRCCCLKRLVFAANLLVDDGSAEAGQ
jgi:hypothetical protein